MADWLEQVMAVGALITDGHFVYTSGKHGDTYFNKDAVFMHTELTSALCEQIAKHYAGQQIDVVIGPVAGGVVMSQWVADHLSRLDKRPIMALYADKTKTSDDGAPRFIIKRGYDKQVSGRCVLIVDDVLNQGSSVRALHTAVEDCGGKVVGVGCLLNRYSHTNKTLHVPELHSVIKLNLHIMNATACELCQKGVPLNTDFGKNKTG